MKVPFLFLQQRSQVHFPITVFLFQLLLFLSPTLVQAATIVSVDHRVKVTFSNPQPGAEQNTYSTEVRIKNHSAAPLLAPLRLSVSNIEGQPIQSLNATGIGADGQPYIEFPLPQGELAAGETTPAITLTYHPDTASGKSKRNDQGRRVSAGVIQTPLTPRASPYALNADSGPTEVRFSVLLADRDKAVAQVYLRSITSGQIYPMIEHGKELHEVRVTIDPATLSPDTCLAFEAYHDSNGAEVVSAPLHLCVSSFSVRIAKSNTTTPIIFPGGIKAVADEILVSFVPNTSVATIRNLLVDINASVVGSLLPQNMYQAKLAAPVSTEQLIALIDRLKTRPEVIKAYPNVLGAPASTPNDPEFSNQHGLTRIRAHDVWDAGATGLIKATNTNIIVAVLDTGINANHPDFGTAGDCQLVADNDCGSGNTDFDAANGHGTSVAGVIAAKTNNALGVAGVAPGSRIKSIRIGTDTSYTLAEIRQGFLDAASYGSAKVVNASFGIGPIPPIDLAPPTLDVGDLCASINSVVLNGVTPVAIVVNAAGNSESNGNFYPGRCNDSTNTLHDQLANKSLFITAGASASVVISDCGSVAVDQRCNFSNYGAWVDIAAPGAAIRTTAVGGSYTSVTGTSFSAPMVSGAAAILHSCGVPLDEIESTLKTSATVNVSYPASGANPAGTTPRLDIYRALQQRNRAPTAVSLSNSSLVENTNTTAGVEVGTLTATDLDTCDKFTYSIVGGADAASFSVTGSNADRLRITAGMLNFATKPSYSVTVRVTDFGNQSVDSNLTIAVLDTTAPVLTASVAGGTYTAVQNVILSANESATIYYTLDGTTPTTASSVYSAAIAVNNSLTLKYYAIDLAGNASTVQTQTYVIDTVAPTVTASVAGGTYASAQSVTLSASESATIYYTLNGTTPTTASTVYSAAIAVSNSLTLKYYAIDTAGNASAVQTQAYVIDTVVPTVTASVAGGTYTAVQSVTLSANESATIYYTLDGTTPSTASTVYSTALTVSNSLTLKYYAVDTAGNASAVQTQVYVIDTVAPTVTASVVGGTYTAAQSVTLSVNESATIYYTLDGTTPGTASTVYSAAIAVNNSLTLKYYAIDTAGNASAVQTQTYVIDTIAPTVTASVVGGTYTSTQSVTLSTNESATIYYTLDGSTPTTSSAIYSSAIAVNNSLTLKYYAVDTAGNTSTVQTQTYVINLPDTVAPAGSVVINNGAPITLNGTVTLTLAATDDSGTVAQMRFSNDGVNWSVWEAYATNKIWSLSAGFGNKTVYAQFRDAAGNISASANDSITYAPDVDLVPTALSTTAVSVRVGGKITVNNTVMNQGRVTASASSTVSYYLSTDANITTADRLIGSRSISNLAAGASSTANPTITLPPAIGPGTYYLGVIADSANVQPEINETNNARVASGTLTVN